MTPAPANRRLAAILSADVVGYSRLMAEDEAATVRTLTDYREEVGMLVRQHRGRVVDFTGDNFLAEFPTATDAVSCAVEIQGVLTVRNEPLPAERKMQFRIGIHSGEVRDEAGRLYGDGVNIAARLEGLAEPGGLCISDVVHKQLHNKLDLDDEDLGEQQLKNIPEPVRVYRVRLDRARREAPRQARRPRNRLRTVVVAATVILLVGVGFMLFWPPPLALVLDMAGLRTPSTRPALSDRPSDAVLPFVNMSGDAKQEYCSDGITEEISTELARFEELLVVGRSSTFQYKGKPIDPRKVGQELGARYVLEGSVRRAADTIRVTAQLLDADKGMHVWAHTYERDLTAANLFALQDEITAEVVATIGSGYGVIARARLKEIGARSTESLDAYDCVLRSYAYWYLSATQGEHDRLRECLERAVKLDPGFAPAWYRLADVYLDEHRFRYNPRPGSLDRALKAARRAVELDPTSSRVHQALAQTHFFRRELALFFVEADRALALDPNDDDTLATVGLYLAYAGRWDRGVVLVKRAIALTPSPPVPKG
jgi:adenylate cyclase